jgi:hypothetical protein
MCKKCNKVNNYKCPKTDKEFYIQRHRSLLVGSTTVYKDHFGKVLINPQNGESLIPIERKGPIQAPMVMRSTSDRIKRNTIHFKERAKKHANSEEGKYEKQKNLKREIDNTTKRK